jgi:hypothetical protein
VPRHPGPAPRRLDAAVAALRWPDICDQFNWALDWFDPFAVPDRTTADPISPMPAEILHPINASGGLNSWNYRRPSPEKSDVSNCGLPKTLAIQMI